MDCYRWCAWIGAMHGDLSGYPYGDPYDAQVCNGAARAEDGPVAVGTRSACVTIDGVFDLSGNAAEWTAECDGESEPTNRCKVRGGSYVSDGGDLSCGASRSLDRNGAADWVGFRCCADAG
jgi:formylglycine-generating enzyme required for sulfatase activity